MEVMLDIKDIMFNCDLWNIPIRVYHFFSRILRTNEDAETEAQSSFLETNQKLYENQCGKMNNNFTEGEG